MKEDEIEPTAGLALSPTSMNELKRGREWRLASLIKASREVIPGVGVSGGIALLGVALHYAPGMAVVSPLMLSMIIGAIFANLLGRSDMLRPGINFAIKRILRFAIVTLGLQITFQQLGSVGGVALCVIAVCLVSTLIFTKRIAPLIGVDSKLAELIAVGTAICGASAIVAANVVTEGEDEDVAYAIGCVTIFGCLAAFFSPMLLHVLQFSQRAYGLWVGSSIHEIAQVVASAFQAGDEAGRYGTIAKLSRVAMLAPAIMVLATAKRTSQKVPGGGRRAVPVPYFVLGFLAMIAVNSVLHLPGGYTAVLAPATNLLMSVSLAAMGLETNIRVLRKKGVRPLMLAAFGAIFISALSAIMIRLLHPV